MKKKIWKVTILFLLLMAVFTIISRSISQLCTPKVEVAYAKMGELSKVVQEEGEVMGSSSIPVITEPGIRVSSVNIRVGSYVEGGTLLFSYDVEHLREKAKSLNEQIQTIELQIADIQANEEVEKRQEELSYQNALASLETVKKNCQRAVDEAKESLDILKENKLEELEQTEYEAALEQAETDYENALNDYETSVSQAQAEVNSVSVRSAFSTSADQMNISKQSLKDEKAVLDRLIEDEGNVYAELSGQVTRMNLEVGSEASGQGDIVISNDDAGKYAEIKVNEIYRSYLSVNQGVIVQYQEEIEGGTWMAEGEGTILSIEEDEQEEMLKIYIDLCDIDANIGDIVTVQVVNSTETYLNLIPREALRLGTSGYFVYMVKEEETIMGTEKRIYMQSVEVLDTNDLYAAVDQISGKYPVIVDSDRQIMEGGKVRFVEESKE